MFRNDGGRRHPPFDARRSCNNHGASFSYQWNRQVFPQHNDQPNFVVQLRSDAQRVAELAETDAVIKKLKFSPQKSNVVASNFIAAALFYEQWSEALEAVVQLWEMKLSDERHSFLPRVVAKIHVPSDKLELDERLKVLFGEKLKSLKEGGLVENWGKKLGVMAGEIQRITNSLRNRLRAGVRDELLRKREGLKEERDLILKMVGEFNAGIDCILSYLENGGVKKERGVDVLQILDGDIEWERMYRLMMRECRRLDDGLPIYAHRRDILEQVLHNQVTVLIGETGSGKSTQLVQFLADSKVSGHGSTICVQPRKLAAISLAERVKEESHGCYNNTSVSCCSSYSSTQQFDSKMIFTTDNCLLQSYISGKQLCKISCIIIDEAHERSINTDILLALIKNLLPQRPSLRLIIMSATMNADRIENYFMGCRTLHVSGRTFPVDIKYVRCDPEVSSAFTFMPSYVCDVLVKVTEITKIENNGDILAFLTSQMEVEWACEKFHHKFQSSSTIALPLHGKLSYEDQHRVFINYPGKRKVIFATNIAETSLTIPGVKYVVDSGMVKESMYEPGTGMNALRICRISQCSANQRAGRAGRMGPGTCYRLYTENDFESMPPHQEPEIRKVHLGVAVLRIITLDLKNVQEFDFVDAPDAKAIDMAVKNLVQLGAITLKNDAYELTSEGRQMVKLGVEPRLGKIILQCFQKHLGREGVVLAAVMANSNAVFCRVGSEEEKLKSDRLKVRFCHPNGDLFTLLAVYKDWESLPQEKKNTWCWENSINAKSMRRCQNTVLELESCLKNELNIIVPNYWQWNPKIVTEHDQNLKNIILSSLRENMAMYSGYDELGYEVAGSQKHVKLHPSCSLLNFCQRPTWVVFGEIFSSFNDYLVCVTVCDSEYFSKLSPPLVFDFKHMGRRQLQKRVLDGIGSALLKSLCGYSDRNLHALLSSIRSSCGDERIGLEVNADQNEVILFASYEDMTDVCSLVDEVLTYRKRLLDNECIEKCLHDGGPIALFGAGAEIKHLELGSSYMTVDIFHSRPSALDEKELVIFLERSTLGCICAVEKFSEEKDRWGRVTFSTPDAAKNAVGLNQIEFCGGLLKAVPFRKMYTDEHSIISKISWPRRRSKGVAIVKCNPRDVDSIVDDLSDLVVGDRLAWCEVKSAYCVKITGFDRDLSEDDVYQEIIRSTDRRIKDFFLVRGDAVDGPPLLDCKEAILREISPCMPKRNRGNCARVQVFNPKPNDSFMTATVTFDGNLHLEAATALERIDGKVLNGCHIWQKIRCQHLFHSHVSCSATVYPVISSQLHSLLSRLRRQKGVESNLETMYNGMGKISSYRVMISASATKVVADLRRPLQQLMEGTIIHHPDMTPAVLQNLFSRDGIMLMKSIQRETGTHIIFERHRMIVRVFGSPDKIEAAQNRLVKALSALHDSKQLEIQLRDGILPPDMMKRVVQHFGPDLNGLKQKVPDTEFSLNTRRHSISIVGTKESKQKVENIIHEIADTSNMHGLNYNDDACSICLCEIEDAYMLENCGHVFCRLCLIEQCESAIRSHDGSTLQCAKQDCKSPILLSDFRSLLCTEKLEALFSASLNAYVAASGGKYRFCPSPDCPSVYRVADPSGPGSVFACRACFAETCTQCHLEYHAYLTCEKYRLFKDDPDFSLKEWCSGKDNVKNCPGCGFTIEKVDGCNHVECRCGRHVCWVCLQFFEDSENCYRHLRSIHTELFEFML